MTFITTRRLARDVEAFLEFKRALGHPYKRSALMLLSFQRYVEQHAGKRKHIAFETLLSNWLARRANRKPVTVALELGVIRQLCLYRCRYDPDSFVPDRSWAPQAAESDFLPFVFTDEQVRAIIAEAKRLPGRNNSPVMLRAFILVLYCTGLRLGEAARLRMDDVDLRQQAFTICHSKGKTRIVPFRDDLTAELNTYLLERASFAVTHDAFWVRRDSSALTWLSISATLRRLLRQLGLKPPSGRVGPRPYDLDLPGFSRHLV